MAAETAAGPDGRSTYRTFEPAGSSSQRPHRAIVSRERAEHVPAERSPDLPLTAAIAIHQKRAGAAGITETHNEKSLNRGSRVGAAARRIALLVAAKWPAAFGVRSKSSAVLSKKRPALIGVMRRTLSMSSPADRPNRTAVSGCGDDGEDRLFRNRRAAAVGSVEPRRGTRLVGRAQRARSRLLRARTARGREPVGSADALGA